MRNLSFEFYMLAGFETSARSQAAHRQVRVSMSVIFK
jgi:hypothetical protein